MVVWRWWLMAVGGGGWWLVVAAAAAAACAAACAAAAAGVAAVLVCVWVLRSIEVQPTPPPLSPLTAQALLREAWSVRGGKRKGGKSWLNLNGS